MTDVLMAIVMWLTGGVDPIRPAPLKIAPGYIEVQTIPAPQPHVLWAEGYGPGR